MSNTSDLSNTSDFRGRRVAEQANAQRPARPPWSGEAALVQRERAPRQVNLDIDPDRGRQASKPSDIPARGWKDILWRVYENVTNHRVMAVAAGVTFYVLLALFPGIAALVSLYGLFADPTVIGQHLADLSGVIPEGATQVIAEQLKNLTRHGSSTLGATFLLTLAISLWSANSGMKAMFDALNIVYAEPEMRSFIKLNAWSLAFTVCAIVFLIVALAAMVVLPALMSYIRLTSITDWIVRIGRWPVLLAVVAFAVPVRPQPRESAMALDKLGKCLCCDRLAGRVFFVFLLHIPFRKLQQDLRLFGSGIRVHDMDMAFRHCDPAWSGTGRRDGASDRPRHDE
jgi:membrane protein